MKHQVTKRVSLALGVASVATSMGNVAVKAGPALQTLNNLTNTAEFSINNTYGQSFSVDGILGSVTLAGGTTVTAIAPFQAGTAGGMVDFTAGQATLTTNFQGGSFSTFKPVSAVAAVVASPGTALAVPIRLNTTAATTASTPMAVTEINLVGGSTTQTIGASISSTLFGPSAVKASSSFTNQLINDLSAF